MPLKGKSKASYQREYMRRRRAKKKARDAPPVELIPKPRSDPGRAIAEWSAACLKIPPGHSNAGKPLVLPDYLVSFVEDIFRHRESLLCLARKQAKSSAVAVVLLSMLRGPTRTDGFRAGVVSVSAEKSRELQQLMEGIASASGLSGLRFLKSPQARAVGPVGSVDFHAAERTAGAASGYDMAVVDEIGLLKERDRDLVNGMRSSTSAKNGRFVALSIRGDGPFIPEILARRGDPDLSVHLYESDPKKPLDDEANWRASNPGLGSIKSIEYMKTESRRVLATPADENAFRAQDLNQAVSASRAMICSLSDWVACVTDKLPERTKRAVVGVDLGGSSSMTAAVALFVPNDKGGPVRVEVWGAFPDDPDLKARSKADGENYELMERRGELQVYSGRVTPVGEFLRDLAGRLEGVNVLSVGADRFRKSEALQAFDSARVSWPIYWRGQGASATADGSADVRSFQKLVLSGRLRLAESLLMASAIKASAIRYDPLGNPSLHKAGGRIDALSAAVIAAGLAEQLGDSVYAEAPAFVTVG